MAIMKKNYDINFDEDESNDSVKMMINDAKKDDDYDEFLQVMNITAV